MIDNALFPIHFFWRGGRGIFREALELSGYSHIWVAHLENENEM